MQVQYDGTITTNKPLTSEAIDSLRNVKRLRYEDDFVGCFEEGMTEIVFEEETVFDDVPYTLFKHAIQCLKKKGFVLNGEIEYWDEEEGTIYIKDNNIDDYV